MRSRLPQHAHLLAFTATLRHGKPMETICTFLRLLPGKFHFLRRSNARRDVQIIFRTMQSAATGHQFPELAWIMYERRKFIIFAKEINVGFRLIAYLWHLSQSMPGIQMPTLRLYNSLNWPSHNTETLALLHTPEQTLPIIVIATDTLSLGRAGRNSSRVSNPRCFIYISRSTIATAQRMVGEGAENIKDNRRKLGSGSGDSGMDISAAQLIAAQCKSEIIDLLYNNPANDVPCKCEGCLFQEHNPSLQCQCSGCKTDITPVIFTPPNTGTSTQAQKKSRRLTKAMREHGVKQLQLFRLKLWQAADEAKTSWTPPSAFIPDIIIKTLLDHIDIIESANDITSWDGDNELLQPHTEELLQFIRDLQVQFEEMRRSARLARMSAKGKTSSKEDESEDDLEDEDEADEEPREAPIASGIRWILRPSYVFTASLGDN
ncbi:hypothetical protein AX14_006324 [Amanita brunnescens Koide BX004]|nr:hypothetical protein AX14_006324 [Amanita brunnescens Koide BX004]